MSSSAHMFGKINFEDLQSRRSYQPWIAYGQCAPVFFHHALTSSCYLWIRSLVHCMCYYSYPLAVDICVNAGC